MIVAVDVAIRLRAGDYSVLHSDQIERVTQPHIQRLTKVKLSCPRYERLQGQQ